MIDSTTATPSFGPFGDLLDSLSFDPKRFLAEDFGPYNFPSLGDVLGESARAMETQRKNLEALKSNVGHLDNLLDVASRRLFLTDWHKTSVRFFEQLVPEAPLLRRFVERADAALANGRLEDMEQIIAESNAGVERVEKIRQEAETEHLAAVSERLADLFKLHHRQFEHRIAQLLNFDGFTVERWNGGAGDLAADVVVRLPAPDGRRAIVQCKHTSDPRTTIGSGVIQQVSGTRQAHDAELAFVVTTGSFTKPAKNLAKRLDVQLADCNDMLRWALGGFRLLDLLDLRPASASSTAAVASDSTGAVGEAAVTSG
ncbi:restriction endonuclease [Streptomyces sp. PT19]|uniref:restriction endonuclease n=1 Tax=Streptomyces sp. PT19 TaxID=3452239 RepID=UPI003F80907E